MIAWGLGYLLIQLLYNFIVSSLNMTYYLFLGMHAAIGMLISYIGGRVMFKSIQDS